MTDPSHVQALREELFDAGFRPVPISNPEADHPSAGKAPFGMAWQERAREDPPEAIRVVRTDALNTGVLCDGLRALDIDVDDVARVQRIRAMAVMAWGEAPMRVRDNSPRCLLVYRAAEGQPPKRKIEGRHGKVEILGRGQQFVAYGRHPSGADLRWMPESLHQVPLDQLPVVTEEQITSFFAEIAPLLEANAERNDAGVKAEDPEDVRALYSALTEAGAAAFRDPENLPPEVAARLRRAFEKSNRVRDRWAGLCDDLIETGRDHSRSGMDMSLAALLKAAGASPLDAAMAILVFPHGSAHVREKHPTDGQRLRYAARTALRAGQLDRRHEPDSEPNLSDDFDPGEPPDMGEVPPAEPPQAVGLTEDDIALAFAAEHAGIVAFDHSRQMWLSWAEGRWRQDERNEVFNLCRKFTRSVRFAAMGEAKALGKIGFVGAVERAARADPRLATVQSTWDADPYLLGTPRGTVDLRTGILREARPEDRIDRHTLVVPAPPGSPAALWERFLQAATGEDEELISFLHRFAGYCLTGDVSEEMLGFLYGPGGNGKGVFIGTIVAILHTYAVAMPIEAFTAGSRMNPEYYRAQMAGARLVTASETEAGATWAESQIKELTGNEAPVSARHPYGKPFTYRPLFKLWIVGNHAPRLKGRSPAMERRLRIIPFDKVPPAPDPDLKRKLEGEYPAILRWMIDGCLAWQEARLGSASAVSAASADYFAEQDAFGRWLSEGCILDPTLSTPSGQAYAAYRAWCQANGEEPFLIRAWAETVDRHPKLRRGMSSGKTKVFGLGLPAESRFGSDDYGR